MIYYSASENGFIDPAIYGPDIPSDSVEIGAELYASLREGVATGLIVVAGDDGIPKLEMRPPLTADQLTENALRARDGFLAAAAIRTAPLQDAVDLEDATPAESALLKEWKQYRVALNRIQDQAGFPSDIQWPVAPE